MSNTKNKIAIVNRDIETSNGMLYKGTRVRIVEERNTKDRQYHSITVTDLAGRLFYIKHSDISVN